MAANRAELGVAKSVPSAGGMGAAPQGDTRMHKVMAVGALCAALATTAQAETLELDGIGNARDVACKGQDVSITGNANHFRLSGDCGRVEVHGSEHVISMGKVASLEVTGGENQIEAERVAGLDVSGADHRITARVQGDGEQPAPVVLYGGGNVLTLDLQGPVRLEVNGIGQQVTWRGDDPTVETSGGEHRIQRQ